MIDQDLIKSIRRKYFRGKAIYDSFRSCTDNRNFWYLGIKRFVELYSANVIGTNSPEDVEAVSIYGVLSQQDFADCNRQNSIEPLMRKQIKDRLIAVCPEFAAWCVLFL